MKSSKNNKNKRKSTRFLKRYIVSSDNHDFIGRIFDLSIVELNFDTYEELEKYPDCKYVSHTNFWLSTMVRRIESLNMVGEMLWLDAKFLKEINLPVSRFEWLSLATDAFLMRFVSVADCAAILTNEIFEKGLKPKNCTMTNLQKIKIPKNVLSALEEISKDRGGLKTERNVRFHHGLERKISSDDSMFRMAALWERWGQGLKGNDRHGNRINTSRYLREGLVELQRDFNSANRKLSKDLIQLYDLLFDEFESRFSPKFNDPDTGFGIQSKKSLSKT